jgi:hypothetical protein
METNMRSRSLFTIPRFREVESVYVGILNQTKKVQATYAHPSKFLDLREGLNDTIVPSFENKIIVYTFIDEKLQLLPLADNAKYYTSIEVLYVPELNNLDYEDELPIQDEYMDLFINIAAYYGMQDIGRSDKSELYRADVNEHLQLLGAYAAQLRAEEGRSGK